MNRSYVFLLLVLFVFIFNNCGQQGGNSVTPVFIPGSTPTPDVTPTPITPAENVPTPHGFNSIKAEFLNNELDIILDKSQKSIQEAYLFVVYHSATPSSSGNPISVSGEIEDLASQAGSRIPISISGQGERELPDISYNKYYTNHLEIQKRNLDFLKRMLQEGKKPQEPTKDKLIAKGKIDTQGFAKIDSYGDSKLFWILYYSDLSWKNRPCTCRAVGEHCYVYIDEENDNFYNDRDGCARLIADYFDNTIYPLVHSNIGTEWDPGIDGDSKIYIILSAGIQNAYYSPTDEYPPELIPEGYKSNSCEAVYIDPILFGQPVDTKLGDTQSLIGHEYAHMVRFAMKFIYSNNNTPLNLGAVGELFDQELSLQEGNSIFVENMLLGRGITNNYYDISPMRSQPLEIYLRIPEKCTLTSNTFNWTENHGMGIYETGFLIVDYIYQKLGYDAIKRFNQADGKVGLNSLYTATGDVSFDDIFDMQAITLALSGKVPDANYILNSVDLTGLTSYGGYNLHNAWSLVTNCGDSLNGIDLSLLGENKYEFSFTLIEWAPAIIRLCNGNSFKMKIKLNESPAGGGQIKAYFFYK